MFEYNQGDAADAGLLWHLGCDIEGASGRISKTDSTKLCIQKFKEASHSTDAAASVQVAKVESIVLSLLLVSEDVREVVHRSCRTRDGQAEIVPDKL